MKAETRAKVFSSIRQAALGSGAMGAALLCLQSANPIDGSPAAPAWLNWAGAVAAAAMLLWFLRFGERDEQVLSTFAFLITGYATARSQPWLAENQDELASTLARTLSSTWNDVAVLALLQGWAVLALGFLCARAALRMSDEPNQLGIRVAAWVIATIVSVFGVRGLIGYASGNLSLLIT